MVGLAIGAPFNALVPASLNNVIRRALDPLPQRRFQSGAQLADALGQRRPRPVDSRALLHRLLHRVPDVGEARADVDLPDNLTTWRMQVRAVSGNTQVGEGLNELVSTQPLLLRPALPRFLQDLREAVDADSR